MGKFETRRLLRIQSPQNFPQSWVSSLAFSRSLSSWPSLYDHLFALFSLPFDLIKSRLMAQKPNPITGEMPYSGVIDCSLKIARSEGPLGFFSGFSAYYGRCAPHAMIILLSIESITNLYRKSFY